MITAFTYQKNNIHYSFIHLFIYRMWCVPGTEVGTDDTKMSENPYGTQPQKAHIFAWFDTY